MQVTIDCVLPPHLSEKYEAVAFRPIKLGDRFITVDGKVVTCESLEGPRFRLIVQEKFTWPSWLVGNFLTTNPEKTKAYIWDTRPVVSGYGWSLGGRPYPFDLSLKAVKLPIPENDPWTRVYENPNRVT